MGLVTSVLFGTELLQQRLKGAVPVRVAMLDLKASQNLHLLVAHEELTSSLAGNSVTTLNHSSPMTVTTREIGCGSSQQLKYNGSTFSSTSPTFLCGSASAPSSCASGQTIIGVDRVWSVYVNNSGLLEFQAAAFIRTTSRTCRMAVLSAGIDHSFGKPKKRP